MAEILSLSRARKERTRAAKKQEAEENRVRFGRTRSERDLAAATTEQIQNRLDAHRRDPDGSPADRDA